MYRSLLKYYALILLGSLALIGHAQSVGGTTSGAATFCGTSNPGFVSLTGQTGAVLYWESSTNGGATWTNIGNPTSTQSYLNLTQTTCYRAVVQQGAFPADTSSVVCITIYPPTVPGTLSAGGIFCAGTGPGAVTLSGNTGNVLYWISSSDGGATWTTITNTTTVQTYSNISSNTIYEAIVQNSSFCAVDTSTQSVFTVDPLSFAGALSINSDTVCFALNNGTVTAAPSTGTITGWLSSTNGGASWTPIANSTSTQTFSSLLQNTLYEMIVKSGSCPADTSNSVGITVLPLPTVDAGSDTTIQPGQSVTLTGGGSGTPFWIPGATLNNPTIYTPIATPTASTSYILVVTDQYSCMNADTVLVNVIQPAFNGIVSNYFTPNNDGVNDTWYIQSIKNFPGNEVSVYNMYGQLVYNQKDYQNDWKGTFNGQDLPDGTYYYVLKIVNPDKVEKGSIDIIRKK